MTSGKVIIPGENPEDLAALRAQWHEAYPTANPIAFRAVERAAHSEWHLLRVQRNADGVQGELFAKPMNDWTDAEHARYGLTNRYATTARRDHERDRRAVAQYRREERAEAKESQEQRVDSDEAEEMLRNKELRNPDPNRKSDTTLQQFAYITVQEGATRTLFVPPTGDILRNLEGAFEVTLVERRLVFRGEAIPAEYGWAAERMAQGKQRSELVVLMTGKSFRQAVEAEQDGPIRCWPALEAADAPIIRSKLGDRG